METSSGRQCILFCGVLAPPRLFFVDGNAMRSREKLRRVLNETELICSRAQPWRRSWQKLCHGCMACS
eukprot:2236121-Lingulodinium_polyedra.AAC.1